MNCPHSLAKAARFWLLGAAIGTMTCGPLALSLRAPALLTAIALTALLVVDWRRDAANYRRDLRSFMWIVVESARNGKSDSQIDLDERLASLDRGLGVRVGDSDAKNVIPMKPRG